MPNCQQAAGADHQSSSSVLDLSVVSPFKLDSSRKSVAMSFNRRQAQSNSMFFFCNGVIPLRNASAPRSSAESSPSPFSACCLSSSAPSRPSYLLSSVLILTPASSSCKLRKTARGELPANYRINKSVFSHSR